MSPTALVAWVEQREVKRCPTYGMRIWALVSRSSNPFRPSVKSLHAVREEGDSDLPGLDGLLGRFCLPERGVQEQVVRNFHSCADHDRYPQRYALHECPGKRRGHCPGPYTHQVSHSCSN